MNLLKILFPSSEMSVALKRIKGVTGINFIITLEVNETLQILSVHATYRSEIILEQLTLYQHTDEVAIQRQRFSFNMNNLIISRMKKKLPSRNTLAVSWL